MYSVTADLGKNYPVKNISSYRVPTPDTSISVSARVSANTHTDRTGVCVCVSREQADTWAREKMIIDFSTVLYVTVYNNV